MNWKVTESLLGPYSEEADEGKTQRLVSIVEVIEFEP